MKLDDPYAEAKHTKTAFRIRQLLLLKLNCYFYDISWFTRTSVYCEDCFIPDDCVATGCQGANSVVCEIPDDGGTGKCTCATPEGIANV